MLGLSDLGAALARDAPIIEFDAISEGATHLQALTTGAHTRSEETNARHSRKLRRKTAIRDPDPVQRKA